MRSVRVGLVVGGVLLGLFCLAGSAYARARTTDVVCYVSAGAPVKGASVRVFGLSGRRLRLRRRARTDADGFVTLVLRGRPRVVRLVARGGVVKGVRVAGSLRAVVRHPGLKHDAYVNPVSTVIDAYAALHRGRSLAFAKREAEHLLRLKPGELAGDGLLDETPFFNGLRFLRDARAHGGVQRYIKHLINQGDQVAFQGAPEELTLFKKGMLIKDAVKAVYTIGNAAYDIFGVGIESKPHEILDQIRAMHEQLGQIEGSLAALRDEITTGLDALRDKLDEAAYNQTVTRLKDLIGNVSTAEDDFRTYVDNAIAPQPDTKVADTKHGELITLMRTIKSGFQQSNDVFYDALLGGRVTHTVPAYKLLGKVVLAGSGHFMTPGDSQQLENFAGYVLQYQMLAFNLIVQWENQDGSPTAPPNAALTNVLKLYLGFSPDQATAWLAANADDTDFSVPPSGDLHDELAYLEGISPVPDGTIVEADGLDDTQGPMWQVNAPAIELGRTIHDRPPEKGMGCADALRPPTQLLGQPMCQYMAKGWTTAQEDLISAENLIGKATRVTGWQPATLSDTQTLFKRPGIPQLLKLESDYWDPYDNTFTTAQYEVIGPNDVQGRPKGVFAGTGVISGYYSNWVDRINVTTVKGTPDTARGTKGTCFFGVGAHMGTNCPVLHVLLGRPTTGERYWP